MKRLFALLSVAGIALATALPVCADEMSPSCTYDKSSAPIAATGAVPSAESAAVESRNAPTTLEPTVQSAASEQIQVAGLFSWFVWCPSTGTYTCRTCCPPLNR